MSAFNRSFTSLERLHTTSQFQRVFDQPERRRNKLFTVLSRENTVFYPRLGMIIAKSNAKRAVDRNTMKRIIRESFCSCKALLPTKDFIVILNQPVVNVQRDEIRQQITKIWKAFTMV